MISVIHMDTSVLIMTERYSRAIYYLIPNVWYLHASSFDNVPAWEYNSMIVGEHVELLVEEYVGDNHREPPLTSGLSRNVPPCYCSPLPQPLLAGLLFKCIIFALHASFCYCSPLPLVHNCTIFLWCLDDPYRNPNMNNKDHRVG